LLYIGDKNNESVYSYLFSKRCQNSYFTDNISLFTCIKGKQPSQALFYMDNDEEEISALLAVLKG